jgi:hypothetical protein
VSRRAQADAAFAEVTARIESLIAQLFSRDLPRRIAQAKTVHDQFLSLAGVIAETAGDEALLSEELASWRGSIHSSSRGKRRPPTIGGGYGECKDHIHQAALAHLCTGFRADRVRVVLGIPPDLGRSISAASAVRSARAVDASMTKPVPIAAEPARLRKSSGMPSAVSLRRAGCFALATVRLPRLLRD